MDAPEFRIAPHELYLFDLRGYAVIENAIAPAELRELVDLVDRQRDKDLGNSSVRQRRWGLILDWGKPTLFDTQQCIIDLIANPAVLKYVYAFCGSDARLDHDYVDVTFPSCEPTDERMHCGGTPSEPHRYYQYQNGQIWTGLLTVIYTLVDVEPGDGGFACVPGSHKANFPFPQAWKDVNRRAPCIDQITCKAGSAIIFTEALTHGALPWRAPRVRKTLFFKYSPSCSSWSPFYYSVDDIRSRFVLSPPAERLLEPPNARQPNRELKRGIVAGREQNLRSGARPRVPAHGGR